MQKPGHRKNPAAVALGRLGGLAGRGKAKARKVTSEMARRAVMARWAKQRAALSLLCLLLLGGSAFCQGTFYTYTFTGDTSPLNVSAMFTAPRDVVQTGLLSMGLWGSVSNFNPSVLGGYMQMGDRRVPISQMYFPVMPGTGEPLAYTTHSLWLAVDGNFAWYDLVELMGGTRRGSVDDTRFYRADVYRYVWTGDPQFWPSDGMWSVTLVPEPSSASLLLLAIAGWQARRLVQLQSAP